MSAGQVPETFEEFWALADPAGWLDADRQQCLDAWNAGRASMDAENARLREALQQVTEVRGNLPRAREIAKSAIGAGQVSPDQGKWQRETDQKRIKELTEALRFMGGVLEDQQFTDWDSTSSNVNEWHFNCRVCEASQNDGHRDGCLIEDALQQARKALGEAGQPCSPQAPCNKPESCGICAMGRTTQ